MVLSNKDALVNISWNCLGNVSIARMEKRFLVRAETFPIKTHLYIDLVSVNQQVWGLSSGNRPQSRMLRPTHTYSDLWVTLTHRRLLSLTMTMAICVCINIGSIQVFSQAHSCFQPQGMKLLGWASMPTARLCQVCQKHKSPFRRRCVHCRKMVAPGCCPEWCLVKDFGRQTAGDEWVLVGVCRPCARRQLDACITHALPDLPTSLQQVLLSDDLRSQIMAFIL